MKPSSCEGAPDAVMLTSASILLPLLLAVKISTSTGVTDLCLESRLEGKFFPQSVFLAKKVTSEAQCRHLCLQAKLCSAYSFRLTTRMCELTADVPSSSSVLSDDVHAVFGVLGDTGQCPEFALDPCNTRPCSVNHLCARVKRQDYFCLHLGSSCGQPLAQQSGAILQTSEGIMARYICPPDQVTVGGNDRSVCLSSGVWSLPALSCLVSQTTATSVSQTTDVVVSETTQTSASQSSDMSVSQTTATSVSQTTDVLVSQTTQTSASQTTQTSASQSSDMSVSQTTQTSASQSSDMSVSQTTQTSASQTSDMSVSQTTDVLESQTTQTSESQTSDLSVSETTEMSVSQTTATSVGCSSPPEAMGHATLTAAPTSTVVGAQVFYQCDQDYYVGGSPLLIQATSTCLSSGSWSVVLCVYLCPPPVTPANATSLTSSVARTVGSTVTYACSLGYNAQPGTVSLCVEGGGWSNVTCVPVSCGIPQTSLIVTAVLSYTGTTFGATASVKCLTGSATIACEATGQWSSSCLLSG